MYSFLKAHRYTRHDPATWLHTASSNPKHECSLNIPDILNNRNDGDSEHCKSDKYSNIKSDGVSDSAESNNRYEDGGTMEIFPYRQTLSNSVVFQQVRMHLKSQIFIKDIFTCILLTHC